MSAEAITLGCRLNFAESETLRTSARDGTIIVNSCAVTAEAVRQTRQAIRRARRERPDARIVATGCAVQLEPDAFSAMPEVDEILLKDFDRPMAAAGFRQRVRSFVAVQTGCDHRCTFCTIWQARGPSRSLPFDAIRDAVARELDGGAAEIVLTGVDITSYEGGLGPLAEQLLTALPTLKRLRLSSLDSIEIDEALFALIAGEPRLMPHFHLSLQAGDDLILKRMKRRHSRAQSVALVERIKVARPEATIGADLIAGFPTESEDAALNSLRPARRLRHHRRPCLPLLAPPEHAGSAHATAGARDHQGPGRPHARSRRQAPRRLARELGRHRPPGLDREQRKGSH
jgi:threonylcarbamoyladenosine tRNA methylthiotransferase MtaB